MRRSNIDPGLEAELAEVAAGLSCELLHVELHGGLVRLFLDRPDVGVTLDDCTKMSKQASALLDAHEFCSEHYVLEVSSPGLDRELYRPQDYRRFVGHAVRITFRSAETGSKKTVSGRLESFDERDGGVATVLPAEGGAPDSIPLEAIKLARLEIEL